MRRDLVDLRIFEERTDDIGDLVLRHGRRCLPSGVRPVLYAAAKNAASRTSRKEIAGADSSERQAHTVYHSARRGDKQGSDVRRGMRVVCIRDYGAVRTKRVKTMTRFMPAACAAAIALTIGGC